MVRQNVRRRGSFFFVARELCLPIATEAVFARLRRAWRPGVSVPDFGGPVPDSRGSLFSRGSPFECSGRDRRAYSILLGRDICRARGRTAPKPWPGDRGRLRGRGTRFSCPLFLGRDIRRARGAATRKSRPSGFRLVCMPDHAARTPGQGLGRAASSDATYVAPEEEWTRKSCPSSSEATSVTGPGFGSGPSSGATYVASEQNAISSADRPGHSVKGRTTRIGNRTTEVRNKRTLTVSASVGDGACGCFIGAC